MRWQSLEQEVRDVSALHFGLTGVKENINGVDLDCVIKKEKDYWIIVEITKQKNVEKIRTDVTRLVLVRRYLFEKQNIATKCYVVCLEEPTQAMKDTGLGHGIDVVSRANYVNAFFDFKSYIRARELVQFGSSVHPITGQPDTSKYVPVKYISDKKEHTIEDIAKLIEQGKHVILTGEYGSGKSRCFREAFYSLSQGEIQSYFLAIDLKTTWGLNTGEEIIRRHFDIIGMSSLADFAIRAYNRGLINFLLDGFDEIGSQSWSDDPSTIKKLRYDSLRGVRELIVSSKAGILVTGREHYFNNDTEMMRCLGIDEQNNIRLKCHEQFSEEELESFLQQISDDLLIIPEWLPRRPLMCQAIASLEKETLAEIFEDEHGDISFWNSFIDILCKREARIRTILDPDKIKDILICLSRITRTKNENVGPLSYSDIQAAFETVIGTHPVEEASVLLQRLPGLGRTSLDADDRRFIDTYILDGLRALDLIKAIEAFDVSTQDETWKNPLDILGQRVFASYAQKKNLLPTCMTYIHKSNSGRNRILISDIVCSVLWSDEEKIDFDNLIAVEGECLHLNLSQAEPQNLIIKDSIIYKITFPSKPIKKLEIIDCQIQQAYGVTGLNGVPQWVKNSHIEHYESLATTSAIKNMDLSPQHRILVTILKKTFFQPGAGRQEAALLRGLGQIDKKGYTTDILRILITADILEKSRGDHGVLYIPNRKHYQRVGNLVAKLNLSNDPLWQDVSKI